MKKLKQIDFDPRNLNHPHVITLYRNGDTPYKIVYKDTWGFISTYTEEGDNYYHSLNGSLASPNSPHDLVQYVETSLKTPENYWEEKRHWISVGATGFFYVTKDEFDEFVKQIKNGEIDFENEKTN